MTGSSRCLLAIVATAIMFPKGQSNRYKEISKKDSPLAGEGVDFSLEDVVVDFLEDYKDKNGYSLWDFDIMGENKRCKRDPNNRAPVKAEFSLVDTKAAGTKSTKPVVAYTQLFHNGQPDRNETATIKKETTRLNTDSFTVDRGISMGTRGTFTASVMGFLEVSSSLSLTFSSVHGTTKVNTKTVKHSIDTKVNIPAESTVRVDWIITEEILDIPWKSDVDLKGYFAGEFEKDGNRFWTFFDVKDLNHPDLVKTADGVYFQSTGFYRGIQASNNYVFTREKLHNPKYAAIKSPTKKKISGKY